MHRRSHELWLSRFVSQARAPEVLKEPIPGCADRLGHYNCSYSCFTLILLYSVIPVCLARKRRRDSVIVTSELRRSGNCSPSFVPMEPGHIGPATVPTAD